ncbi:MAG: hypothetical protein EA001_15465 [Oscillatoriales cyanobacterium]|nr:MAG: hypothetical protein EA001_15465 [Oscillatoriales cyanobacterium]
MKLLKKLLAGGLLTLGGFFLLAALMIPFSLPKSGQTAAEAKLENQQAALGCALLGLPPSAIGGWLVWDLAQRRRRLQRQQADAAQRQLRSLLLDLIQQGDGEVTLFEFAMRSELPADHARDYLDRVAIEFGADCDIDDHGATHYRFPVSRS